MNLFLATTLVAFASFGLADAALPRNLSADFQSVRFRQCMSFNADLNAGLSNVDASTATAIQELAQQGKASAVKSYVVFDSYTQGSNDATSYVSELGSFEYAIMSDFSTLRGDVCGACQAFSDQCISYTSLQDNQNEQNDQNDQNNYQYDSNTLQVNCGLCFQFKCFQYGDSDDKVYTSSGWTSAESAVEWYSDVSQCQMADMQWNGMYVYYGPICTADGNGARIGVFLDQSCTIHMPFVSVNAVESEQDNNYITIANTFVQAVFKYPIECSYGYYQYANNNDNNSNEDQEEEEEYINWCENLNYGNGGSFAAVSYDSCQASYASYELSASQAANGNTVCSIVKSADKSGKGGTYNGLSKSRTKPFMSLFIALLVIGGVGAGFWYARKEGKLAHFEDKVKSLFNKDEREIPVEGTTEYAMA